MGRVYALIPIIILILALPLVSACFSPSDRYAVEVVLNKPGIEYSLSSNVPREVIVDGKNFILKVWNGSDGLHVRVEIPLVRHLRAYWRYSGAFIITSDALEKLKESGWIINGSKLIKGNATFQILNRGGECKADSDCATGGCSGEICGAKGDVEKIVTPCVYAGWYECFRLTTCGCVNGTCSWKPNPEFEKCLRSHGVDPSKVIRAGPIEVTARGPDPRELEEAVKEFIKALGINCTRIEIHSGSVEGPAYNTSSVNASKVVEKAFKELSEIGLIKGLAKEDVEAIAKVSRWGKAGWNSHIGWYETENGTYAWTPYDESKDPILVRFVGCGSLATENHTVPSGKTPGIDNNGTLKNTSLSPDIGENPLHKAPNTTSKGNIGVLCGPASLVLISLAGLVKKKR